MTEHSKTYESVEALRVDRHLYPEGATIVDRDGDPVWAGELYHLRGVYAPYTVTWEEPDLSAVKAGDRATLDIAPVGHAPGFSVEGEVYESGGPGNPRALVVGGYLIDHHRSTLTAHQPAPEPEPELPTANGSRVRQPRPDLPDLEPVEAVLVGGVWVRLDEPPDRYDRLNPTMWRTGWELVYDAGAEQ